MSTLELVLKVSRVFLLSKTVERNDIVLSDERKDELYDWFYAETNDEETLEYRFELTEEEELYIQELDRLYDIGMNNAIKEWQRIQSLKKQS